MSRFPSRFRHRRSLLGHPAPAEELGPPCGRLTWRAKGASGPRRGFRVPHARAAIGLGALYTPGTAVLTPAGGRRRPAPAALPRPVPQSCYGNPPAGVRFTRHQRGFKQFTRPIFPGLWPPGWNGQPLGFSSGFAPRRPRAGRRTPRMGQAVEHGPGTTRSTSHPLILQSAVHSFRATSRRTVPSRRLVSVVGDDRVRFESGSAPSRRSLAAAGGSATTARWGDPMATSGEKTCPPAGRTDGRHWGETDGR